MLYLRRYNWDVDKAVIDVIVKDGEVIRVDSFATDGHRELLKTKLMTYRAMLSSAVRVMP